MSSPRAYLMKYDQYYLSVIRLYWLDNMTRHTACHYDIIAIRFSENKWYA